MSEKTATGAGVGDLSPGVLGALTKHLVGLFKSDPKAAKELLADSAMQASVAKSVEDSERLLRDGADSSTGHIEDQWSGPPDDRLETAGGHGPGSTSESGKVNVGPSQAASGDGAERMVPQYSRVAPQGGVQEATTRLGRELMAMRKSQKALLEAFKAQGARMDLFQGALASLLDLPEAMKAEVAKAVTEAVVQAKAAKKSESEKDSEKEKESAKAAKKSESEEKESDFSEHEAEDDAEDEAETDKALKAKSFLGKARDAARKSVDASIAGDAKAASAWAKLARTRISKTGKHDQSEDMAKQLMGIAKALPRAKEQNQDKWPASEEKEVGKAGASVSPEQLSKAQEQIKSALEGIGMFHADIRKFFDVVTTGSKNPGALPPVFELVKSDSGVAAVEKQIDDVASAGVVTMEEADKARDILHSLRRAGDDAGARRMPEARMRFLPPPLRALFVPTEQAA